MARPQRRIGSLAQLRTRYRKYAIAVGRSFMECQSNLTLVA